MTRDEYFSQGKTYLPTNNYNRGIVKIKYVKNSLRIIIRLIFIYFHASSIYKINVFVTIANLQIVFLILLFV